MTDMTTDWRKVASAIYKKPSDGKILGSAEIDITDLEAYVSRKRKEGLKITLTHIFTLIISRCLKEEVPQLNCYIRRGRIIHRDQVDAMISVLLGDGSMSSVRVENTDMLNLEQLVEKLGEGIRDSRAGDEDSTMKMKGIMGKIPWPIRTWVFSFVKFITIKMGWPIPGTNLNSKNFGSFVLTNIGTIGLDLGFPALFPISNVPFVFVMGGINKKPVVVNDKIEIRRMMTISSALDHRVLDALHGGKLFRYIKLMIRQPELLEQETS